MDSLRFVLAIVLMVAVVVITNLAFPPSRRQPARVGADSLRASATTTAAQHPATTPPATGSPVTSAAAPAALSAGPDTGAARSAVSASGAAAASPASTPVSPASAPAILVQSPLYRFGVSTAGGAITSAELLRYRSFTRAGPVQLAAAGLGPLAAYRVRVGERVVDLSGLPFTAEPAGNVVLAPGAGPRTIRLVHDEPGMHAEISYTFRPDEYLVDVSGSVVTPGATQLMVELPASLAVNEANPSEDYRALAYVVNSDREGISSALLDKVKGEQVEEGPLSWAAVKNKYFLVAAVKAKGSSPFGGLVARDGHAPHSALLSATLPLPHEGAWKYRLYLGPQENQRLSAIGEDMQDVNPYGWRFLRPIIRPLAHLVIWAVEGMHAVLNLGYGWVLILFGVLIRVVLWPLNARAMRSQLKNMELQPRLKEIQDRLKSDPEKMQKEVMRLYKEEGFNPLGGCLPMLIPMPVLFTLYFVFQGTIEFRGVPFLWLPDLSRADPLYILPILLGATMFLLQWLGLRSTPQPNQQMKLMTYFMPALWIVLFLNFASGLNLYYVAQNIASLPQQLQLLNERKRWQASRKG